MDQNNNSRRSKALHVIFDIASVVIVTLWMILFYILSGIIAALCFIICFITSNSYLLVTGLAITVSLLLIRNVSHFPWFRLSRRQILLVLLAAAVGLMIGLFFTPENCQVDPNPHRQFGVVMGDEYFTIGTCDRGFPISISQDSISDSDYSSPSSSSSSSFSSPSEVYVYMLQHPAEVQHDSLMPVTLAVDLFFYAHVGIIVVFLLSGVLYIFVRRKKAALWDEW